LYSACIKLDSTLPWIEIEGEFHTKEQARAAAEQYLKRAAVKIVNNQEKKRQLKALVTVRR
jgi:hypothetical protein